MKIIHCADLHLDSRLTANFDKNKAVERRAEILNTFVRMVKYADRNDVYAILIAGDMFDTSTVSALTRNIVLDTIVNNPSIDFYYLKGNHDKDGFIDSLEKLPENLKLFGNEWKSYEMGGDSSVIITAIELSADNSAGCYASLRLDQDKINIVMMHGQETTSQPGDNAECINIKELRNRYIDYLALGHIHSYRKLRLDGRGVYCYPGCLEGRGFDEPGQHGFVLLDIDESTKTVNRKFVPFAHRELVVLKADISDCMTSAAIIALIDEMLVERRIENKDLLEIVLVGQPDVECEKNADFIRKHYENDYYYVRVKDKSVAMLDFDEYKHDESLKGEFVRKVMEADEMTHEEKMEVLRFGLKALAGEEIGICE